MALDTAGPEAARPWIEAARPEHPALIDQAHVLDELLGIVNVPTGVWINEEGVLVRPPEPAFPHRPTYLPSAPSGQQPGAPSRQRSPRRRAVWEAVSKIRIQPERYIAAVRDWVANGAASRYQVQRFDL